MPETAAESLAGFFQDPEEVLHAAEKAREDGFKNLDVYGPYPVHGMDEALGIKRSWIPNAVLAAGLFGMIITFCFMAWTSDIDWPVIVGGKPFVSWPALVPISFAGMVLLAGLSNLIGLLIACRLPARKASIIDPGITDDLFALVIPVATPDLKNRARIFLEKVGAREIREVYV